MNFTVFSDEELARFVDGIISPTTLGALGLSTSDDLDCPRDEAKQELLRRRINATNGTIGTSASLEILNAPKNSSVRQLIGELARDDRLHQDLLEEIQTQYELKSWPANQLKGRILVNSYNKSHDVSKRLQIVSELLCLKLTWAVLEIIHDMNEFELDNLECHVQPDSKDVLSRGDRHIVRVAIGRQRAS